MSDRKNCDCVQNVGCCVKECRYHTSADHCCARQISVANEYASAKGETFCATFESKSCC